MEKDELILWGSLAGIAGAVTFSVLWGLAILTDGHWLFGVETLSELGGDRPGRCFFNTGVMVMGVMTLPLGAALYQVLGHGLVGRISTIMFCLAGAFLTGIGVFPISTGSPHTFFSWAFFSTVILSMTVMLPPIWSTQQLHRSGSVITIGVVLTGYITIAMVATDVMELALSEALVVMALVIWVIVMAGAMLRERSLRLSLRSGITPGNDS